MTALIKRSPEPKGSAAGVRIGTVSHGVIKSVGNDNVRKIPPATFLSFPVEDNKWELDWY
jgi:hypothetical protein